MTRTAAVPVLVLALAAAAGCGKRGDPLPPLSRTPQAIKEVALAQHGADVVITLAAPRATTGGGRLGVLEIEVLRATREGEMDKVALREVRRAAPGEALVLREPLPAPGTRLRVAARARSGRSTSPLSAVATLVVQPAPAAPSALTADLLPAGVALNWKGELPPPPPAPSPSPAPSAAPSPAPGASAAPVPSPAPGGSPSPATTPAPPPARPKGAGFAVYRRAADGEYGDPLYPALDSPAAVDPGVAPGQRWCYEVRTRASATPLVESAASNEVCVDVTDVAPPAAPAGVAAVPREDTVEISWSPSADADLAGYRVYRAAPGEAPVRIAEVGADVTRHTDPGPGRGTPHHYTVTAVDRAGNESAPSDPAEAHLP